MGMGVGGTTLVAGKLIKTLRVLPKKEEGGWWGIKNLKEKKNGCCIGRREQFVEPERVKSTARGKKDDPPSGIPPT